jgi:hypothetical protein
VVAPEPYNQGPVPLYRMYDHLGEPDAANGYLFVPIYEHDDGGLVQLHYDAWPDGDFDDPSGAGKMPIDRSTLLPGLVLVFTQPRLRYVGSARVSAMRRPGSCRCEKPTDRTSEPARPFAVFKASTSLHGAEYDFLQSDGSDPFGAFNEPEGLDWYDLGDTASRPSGQLHVLTVDRDPDQDNTIIDHYSVGCSGDPTPVADPRSTPEPNAAGWHNAPVTVDWRWTDQTARGFPGYLDPNRCELSESTGPREYSRSSTGLLTGVASVAFCTDQAGNEASARTVNHIDLTAPTFELRVEPRDPLVRNQRGYIDPAATDTPSGIATVECDDVPTTSLGVFEAGCSATDVAGNEAFASIPYTVVFADLDKIRSPKSGRPVQRGSAVPFRATLADELGRVIDDELARDLAERGAVRAVLANGPPGPTPPVAETTLFYEPGTNEFVGQLKVPKSATPGSRTGSRSCSISARRHMCLLRSPSDHRYRIRCRSSSRENGSSERPRDRLTLLVVAHCAATRKSGQTTRSRSTGRSPSTRLSTGTTVTVPTTRACAQGAAFGRTRQCPGRRRCRPGHVSGNPCH